MGQSDQFRQLVGELKGLSQVRITETEHRLELEAPLWALNLRPLVEQSLAWGASIELRLSISGTFRFDPQAQDVELLPFQVDAPHREELAALLQDQECREYRKWERWKFAEKCTGPGHPELATVLISFVKSQLVRRIWPDFPSNLLLAAWFTDLESWHQQLLSLFYQRDQQPTLVIAPRAEEYRGQMVVCLPLAGASDYAMSLAAKGLLKACEPLSLLRKEHTRGVQMTGVAYYPPEFWLPATVAEDPPAWALQGLLLSVLFSACDKVERNQETWEFRIDRQYVAGVDITLKGGRTFIRCQPVEDWSLRVLLEFAQQCVVGKPFEGNRKLLQNAIFLAGNFDMGSVIHRTNELLRYYNFEYRAMLEKGLKEQSDTVKAFLMVNQDLRNKLQGTIEQFYSAFAVVATGLAGIFFGLVAAGFRDNDRLFSIAFFACLVYTFLYVPVWVERLFQLKTLAEKWVHRYRADLGLVERLHQYPLHRLAGNPEDPAEEVLSEISRHYRVTLYWSLLSCGVTAVAGLFLLGEPGIDFVGSWPAHVKYPVLIVALLALVVFFVVRPVAAVGRGTTKESSA